MFRETEDIKVVETDFLEAAPTDDDEHNMDVQKCSGTKDNSGSLQCKPSHFSSSTKTASIQYD